MVAAAPIAGTFPPIARPARRSAAPFPAAPFPAGASPFSGADHEPLLPTRPAAGAAVAAAAAAAAAARSSFASSGGSWMWTAARSFPFPSTLQTTAAPTERWEASAGCAWNWSEHGWPSSWRTPLRADAFHFLTDALSRFIRVSLMPVRCSAVVSARTRSALNPCDHDAAWKATGVWRFTASRLAATTSL